MARSTKLSRSNRAHARLMNYHKKRSNGENTHFVKMNYHSSVLYQQRQKKRLLSKEEKKSTYNFVIRAFFG